MTNRKFAETDSAFKKACESIEVTTHHIDGRRSNMNNDSFSEVKAPLFPSRRQASKFRMGKGVAFLATRYKR